MKKVILVIMIIFVITFIIIYMFNGFSKKLIKKEYDIITNKITEDIKIALITDLHSCYYGQEQEELIDMVDLESPDLVVLTGDIIDDDLPIFNSLKVLDYVGSNYPSFYVTGNHEFRSGYIDYCKDMVKYYNVNLLEGNNKIVEIKGNIVNISGVDDYVIGKDEYIKQLDRASKDLDEDKYSILLAHRPEHIELYKGYEYDLVLSGHAHGGQWIVPGIINGVFAPNQGVFPKYAGGLYKHDKLNHIVGRGLAKESTRLVPRIFNPPELVIINLKSER